MSLNVMFVLSALQSVDSCQHLLSWQSRKPSILTTCPPLICVCQWVLVAAGPCLLGLGLTRVPVCLMSLAVRERDLRYSVCILVVMCFNEPISEGEI